MDRLSRELQGKEPVLAYYKHAAHCLQFVIETISEPSALRRYVYCMRPEVVGLEFLKNQHASHVFQALLEASLKVLSHHLAPENQAKKSKRSSRNQDLGASAYHWSLDFIENAAEFVVGNLWDLVDDQNGSYVVITVLEATGGIRVGRHWSRKTMGFNANLGSGADIEKDIVIKDLPPQLMKCLERFATRLIIGRRERDLREILLNVNSRQATLIEYLLFIARSRDSEELCPTITSKMINVIFNGGSSNHDSGNVIPDRHRFAIATNASTAFLVEAVLLAATEDQLEQVWKQHLKGHLKFLWRDNYANFIVQRLIDAVSDEAIVSLSYIVSMSLYNLILDGLV